MSERGVAQAPTRPLLPQQTRNTFTTMRYIALVPFVILAACDSPSLQGIFTMPPIGAETAPSETLDPTPPPPPPPTARTVDQFDTTTAEDRAEATNVTPVSSERSLGTTNVSLGSAADPGFWLKTPLVSTLVEGRVVNPANGRTLNLELRPSGGASGSGSQLSLAAMRLLDLPLTALADVAVYSK